MADMTVIYSTVNKLPESWVEFHKRHLEDSITGYPVITICCKPVDIRGEVDRFIQPENTLSYHQYNKFLLELHRMTHYIHLLILTILGQKLIRLLIIGQGGRFLHGTIVCFV
jgi:hypothetical protein